MSFEPSKHLAIPLIAPSAIRRAEIRRRCRERALRSIDRSGRPPFRPRDPLESCPPVPRVTVADERDVRWRGGERDTEAVNLEHPSALGQRTGGATLSRGFDRRRYRGGSQRRVLAGPLQVAGGGTE